MAMAEDAGLMQRYCDGDFEAFRDLYDRTAPRLLRYLVRMAGERSLAEDLLQQTFLKIHRARGAYVRGADPLPWMYAIAHRTFLDEARRRKRARERADRLAAEVREPAASLGGSPEGAHDPPPRPLIDAALAALQELPPRQREALVLTKLDGKSVAEAATIAGTTPGALKVRAHRGYTALRKALAHMRGES